MEEFFSIKSWLFLIVSAVVVVVPSPQFSGRRLARFVNVTALLDSIQPVLDEVDLRIDLMETTEAPTARTTLPATTRDLYEAIGRIGDKETMSIVKAKLKEIQTTGRNFIHELMINLSLVVEHNAKKDHINDMTDMASVYHDGYNLTRILLDLATEYVDDFDRSVAEASKAEKAKDLIMNDIRALKQVVDDMRVIVLILTENFLNITVTDIAMEIVAKTEKKGRVPGHNYWVTFFQCLFDVDYARDYNQATGIAVFVIDIYHVTLDPKALIWFLWKTFLQLVYVAVPFLSLAYLDEMFDLQLMAKLFPLIGAMYIVGTIAPVDYSLKNPMFASQ